jgi:type I restriction enzyme, S subunit
MTARIIRIGDVITLSRRPVIIDPAAPYEYIGVRSFGKGLIRYPPTPGDSLSKLRYFELPPNALILSNIKAWEGAITVSTGRDDRYIASNRFLSYLPIDAEEVDTRYLSYFFLSQAGLPLIERASPGAADRNRTLGIEAFENLKVPLPDFGIQRSTADRLDCLHKRRHEASEHAKKAVPLIKALHSAVCRVNGRTERVGSKITLIRHPIDIHAAKQYRQIGIYSFGKGMIRRDPVPGAELSKLRYFEVPPDALVLSNIQAWEGAIAVSTEEDTAFIASNRFLSYVPVSEDVNTNYLRYFFLSDSGHPLIQQASPGSLVRNRTLGIKAFENLQIPMPGISEQRRIAGLLDHAYDVLRRIDAREKLLDALLAAALNHEFNRDVPA